MNKRTYWIILGIGAFLRLINIWAAGLWYDENFSLLLSRLPFLTMFTATMGDVHPPLYYMLIWPIGHIPNMPPWAVRVPSAFFSIVTLALFPRILKRLWVPINVQVVAFGMLALLAMQIHYAQEARMYALIEMLMLLGVLAVLEHRLILLGITTAALLYTQNYGVFYVATLGILAFMNFLVVRRTEIRDNPEWMPAWTLVEWVTSQGFAMVLGVIAWLPWVPVIMKQAEYINSNYWIFDLSAGGMLYEIWKLFWAFSLAHPAGMVASMLVTFAWLILGIWYLFIKRPAAWPMIAVLTFGPALMAIAVSFLFQPILLFRPLIGITPFLYLACAYPLGIIDSTRGRLFAACFIVPLIIMSIGGYYRYTPEQKQMDGTGNMQGAMDYMNAHWQPGDVIFDSSDLGWINLKPYTNRPQYSMPNCEERFPGAISPATHDALGVQTRTMDQLPPHKRIWFVAVISPMLRDCELARTNAVIGDRKPTFVMQDNKLLLSAIWLMEDK